VRHQPRNNNNNNNKTLRVLTRGYLTSAVSQSSAILVGSDGGHLPAWLNLQ